MSFIKEMYCSAFYFVVFDMFYINIKEIVQVIVKNYFKTFLGVGK